MSTIREGFHTITPYLIVSDAGALSRFLQQVFGAEETMRATQPDGSIMHAEARIGDSMLMFAQGSEVWKPRPCNLYLYVADVDVTWRRGIDAGGKSIGDPEDKPYGERTAGFEDAWGNYWWVGAPLPKAG